MEELLMKYSDFQFTQPLLIKARFDVLPTDEEFNQEVSIDLRKNILRFTGKNKAVVSVTISLNKSKTNVPFTAEVEMQSIFTWKKIGTREINKFLEQNATALLISYIRPIIAILTASSPLKTCNIPFINTTNVEN